MFLHKMGLCWLHGQTLFGVLHKGLCWLHGQTHFDVLHKMGLWLHVQPLFGALHKIGLCWLYVQTLCELRMFYIRFTRLANNVYG